MAITKVNPIIVDEKDLTAIMRSTIELNVITMETNIKENTGEVETPNKFYWKDPKTGKYLILLQSQFVYVEQNNIFSTYKDYGILNLDGRVIIPNSEIPKRLDLLDVVKLVSPEEYFMNTSKAYQEIHPDLKHLINPEVNYIF